MKWFSSESEKIVSFLQGQLGAYSGKSIRRLLEANLCRINGAVERFGSRMVKKGDLVELAPSWKSFLSSKLSEDIELIYEDEALKIVNKPAGWVCDDRSALRSFGPQHYLVHRLDKDTTGLLIVAKSGSARDQLMELFEKRQIAKYYLALVDGVPKEKEGVRRSFLAKKGSFQGQTIWGSADRGLSAVTRWKVVASGKKGALVLCEPETGRTHQIRVHMAEMGHPILIDRQYAKNFRCQLFIQRPLLHAVRLVFSFQGKAIDVIAPLFVDICESLRNVGMEVGHLRELLGKKEEDGPRNERHDHEDAKEIEQSSHFFHESGKNTSIIESDPYADVPDANGKCSEAGRGQTAHGRKANRGQKHFSNGH